MNNEAQYRVAIPRDKNIEQMRAWCKKNLSSKVKVTYRRKYDEQKKKWVRTGEPMFRFKEDSDALAFKLIWVEAKGG